MTPVQNDSARNTALDFTKGILIVVMVVYHWGNYFLGAVPYFYDLLRFLTPSFIFITGAIISMISVARYGLADTRIYRRLTFRGAKLLVLFTALNLGIQFLLPGKSRGATFGLPSFSDDWLNIYLSGNSNSASFKVLLPIAYLLLLSAVFLPILRWPQRLVLALVFAICAGLQAAESMGCVSSNLMLLSFGFLGLTLYCVGFERINRAAARLPAILAAYAFYLGLVLTFGPRYWVQLIGVSLNLLLIYSLGCKFDGTVGLTRIIVLLGRYSLFAYVAQIGILQALRFVAAHLLAHNVATIVVLPAAMLLMVALVVFLDFARGRAAAVDKLYRMVFM